MTARRSTRCQFRGGPLDCTNRLMWDDENVLDHVEPTGRGRLVPPKPDRDRYVRAAPGLFEWERFIPEGQS